MVSPEEAREAAPFQKPLAHAAYRVGEGSILLSRALMPTCGHSAQRSARGKLPNRGGLLVLSDRAAPPVHQPEALSGAILRECVRREYSGVVLDFEHTHREDLRRLTSVLSRQCAASRRTLFVPEACAATAEHRVVIVNTAVSGGSFEEHIRAACNQWGAQRVVLDVQRLCMNFRLPARDGQGTPLTPEAFSTLRAAHQRTVFFSHDLCARYFTCGDSGEGHFVLFDDADTLRQKLRLGQRLGVTAAFFQWQEIRDIADGLFRRNQQ